MGRYSSVQAYSDQQNTRSTTYEQEKASTGSLQTEKVYNPYGSTAGAGSGEFHIYRHARAREQQRLKELDEAEQEKIQEIEFQEKVQEWKTEAEQRLEKNRKKRAREKAAKLRKKNLILSGVKVGSGESHVDNEKLADAADGEIDSKDEFSYKPLYPDNTINDSNKPKEGKKSDADKEKDAKPISKVDTVETASVHQS